MERVECVEGVKTAIITAKAQTFIDKQTRKKRSKECCFVSVLVVVVVVVVVVVSESTSEERGFDCYVSGDV